MSLNEILVLLAIILILIDIFFVSDLPTHIAYIPLTFTITKEFKLPILYQVVIGLLVWGILVTFHYFIWRKILEKISDRIIAPKKHEESIEGFIGQEGLIKELEGKLYITVNDE